MVFFSKNSAKLKTFSGLCSKEDSPEGMPSAFGRPVPILPKASLNVIIGTGLSQNDCKGI